MYAQRSSANTMMVNGVTTINQARIAQLPTMTYCMNCIINEHNKSLVLIKID